MRSQNHWIQHVLHRAGAEAARNIICSNLTHRTSRSCFNHSKMIHRRSPKNGLCWSSGSMGRIWAEIAFDSRSSATAFRQWGQYFLFISFTACSPKFSGGNNIVLPPQPHLSGGKLPPLPYSGTAHVWQLTSQISASFKIQPFTLVVTLCHCRISLAISDQV